MGKKIVYFLLVISLGFTNLAYSQEHIIKVVSDYQNVRMYFDPKVINIKSGDTITWINQQKEKHNMTTYPDGYPEGAQSFMSPYLSQAGDKWSFTFTKVGTYEYHCHPHALMGMRGSIIVDRPSKLDEFHKPTAQELDEYRSVMLKIFDPDEFQYTPKYIRDKLEKIEEKAKKTDK